ncbi:C39 family peptidase [Brachybacterium sp. Marseille-Q7125]|uniref:C39 family peptidase n=1 Tax=Brachybacterium sp. Marseille-Q7125 TaxID=2932815 RepID=UPI001FF1B715|nr:C39 family peptidase [Brachybacterium sp. Marseille-Q7125]
MTTPRPTAVTIDRRDALRTFGTAALMGVGLAAGSAGLSAPAVAATEITTASTYMAQRNSYYCGPTSIWMTLSAKMDTPPSIDTIAAAVETEAYGATPYWTMDDYLSTTLPDATYRFEQISGKPAGSDAANLLWDRVTRNVDTGYASIGYWQAAPNTYPTWYGNPNRIGHYVVIDGYRPETRELLIADPARDKLGGYTAPKYYWLSLQEVANLCGSYGDWPAGYFW